MRAGRILVAVCALGCGKPRAEGGSSPDGGIADAAAPDVGAADDRAPDGPIWCSGHVVLVTEGELCYCDGCHWPPGGGSNNFEPAGKFWCCPTGSYCERVCSGCTLCCPPPWPRKNDGGMQPDPETYFDGGLSACLDGSAPWGSIASQCPEGTVCWGLTDP